MAGFQMQYQSRGRWPTDPLPETTAEGLLAYGKAFRPCHLLDYLVAHRRIQEQIASLYPTDASALRDPTPPGRSRSPTPGTPVVRRQEFTGRDVVLEGGRTFAEVAGTRRCQWLAQLA